MSIMNNIAKLNNNGNLYAILKGFAISIVLSLICIFAYALILVNSSVKESTIPYVLITITGICILIGSSISGLKVKKNGMLNGICVGIAYFLTIYVLSSIALCGFGINASLLIMVAVGIFLGAIGGIIGANVAK